MIIQCPVPAAEQPVDPSTITRSLARALLRTAPRTTLICAIVSHARGKIHCRTYKLYRGGWRTQVQKTRADAMRPYLFAKLLRVYGEHAAEYAARAVIANLDDQAEFIRVHLQRMEERCTWQTPELDARLRGIARQIIGDLPAPPR